MFTRPAIPLLTKSHRCLGCRTLTAAAKKQPTKLQDRKNAGKSKSVDNLPVKIVAQSGQKIEALSKALEAIEEQRIERHEQLMRKRRPMLEAIEEHIVNKPKSRLVTIGSMATGLVYDEHSDVDLCLIPEDERFIDDFHTNINGFKRVFMDAVINMLRQLGGKYPELQLQEVIPLYHTYVPLIIARFVNGLSIDIQIPQRDFQALRNTSLIKHYVAVDNRFGQLYNWLRTVCTALGIKHSKDGLLSSYHILLLTVHFLQDKEAHMQNGTAYPVLPVIPQTHPQLVGYNVAISDVIRSVEEPVTEITWTSKNTKSVGELAVELVDYYASFDYSNTAISIRAGNTYKYVQTPPDVHLRIVDPYAAMPVARSRYIARALAMAMEYVRNKMKMGMMIDTFPEFTQESEIFRRNVEFEDWGKKLLSPDDHAL